MFSAQAIDFFSKVFPEIKLEKVRLRELKHSDAIDLLEYLSRDEVKKFVSDEDIPSSLEEATNEVGYWGGLFRNRHSIYWGIADKSSNQLIGTCGFNYWNRLHRKAEVSYDLAYDYWGKGYMSESLRAIIGFGFEQMGLHRIGATVSPDNEPSIRLLEHLGFQHEGTMRDYKIVHGKFHDALIYSMLRPDFEECVKNRW